jgi:hypothetical protein
LTEADISAAPLAGEVESVPGARFDSPSEEDERWQLNRQRMAAAEMATIGAVVRADTVI